MPKNNFIRFDFNHIAFTQDVTQKAREIILKQFQEERVKTEKLESPDKMPRYSIKLNDGNRVIATRMKVDGSDEDCLVILEDIAHDYENAKFLKKNALNNLKLDKDHNEALGTVVGASDIDGKLIIYSKEQKEAADSFDFVSEAKSNIKYFVINGLAGSGKTTIAYDVTSKASKEGLETIYVSKSERLVKEADKLLESEVECLTHIRLLSKKLFYFFERFVEKQVGIGNQQFIQAMKLPLDRSLKDEAANFYKSGKQAQSDQEKLLDACIQEYLGQNLSGEKEFTEWLKFNYGSKKRLFKAISESDLYQELQKSNIANIGKKGTLHAKLHDKGNKDSVPTILEKYVGYLNDSGKFDPAFIHQQIRLLESMKKVPAAEHREGQAEDVAQAALEGEVDYAPKLLVIDESQNFTPTELEAIISGLEPNTKVYLCRDGNQSLSDPFDLTLQAMYQFTELKPEHVYNLSTSYRSPPAITELANILLQIKAHVIGGKLHKIDSASSSDIDLGDVFRSNTEHNGYVRYIKDLESDKDEMEKLKEVSGNIIESVVIAFSMNQVEDASDLFPDSVVLTPNEVVGLEYQKVILYNPFHEDSMLNHQKDIKEKYDANKSAPTNYPKDLENIGFTIPFNEFFVAVTRSTSDLYILDPQNSHKKAADNFFEQAFAKIFERYQDNESEITAELSLEKLILFIEDNASTYQESVLAKFVKKAIEIISSKPDLGDREKLGYFKRLDNLVKRDDLKESIESIENKFAEEEKAKREAEDLKKDKEREDRAKQIEKKSSSNNSTHSSSSEEGAASEAASSNSSSPEEKHKKHKKKSKHKKQKEASPKAKQKSEYVQKEYITPALNSDSIEAGAADVNGGGSPMNLDIANTAAPINYAREINNGFTMPFDIDSCRNIDTKTLLQQAINESDRWKLRKAYDRDKDIFHKKISIFTPLFLAANNGSYNLVEFILDKEQSTINEVCIGLTPFEMALDKNHYKVAEIIAKSMDEFTGGENGIKSWQPDKIFKFLRSMLIASDGKEFSNIFRILFSIKDKDLFNIKSLLSIEDGRCLTLIHLAAEKKDSSILKYMIENAQGPHTFNIDAIDAYNTTALFHALTSKRKDSADILLKNGANPSHHGIDGKTPLEEVIELQNLELVSLLIKYDANINSKDAVGRSALHHAARKNNKDIVEIIASAEGIKIDAQDNKQNTPLHYAAGFGNTDIVKLLISKGAALNLKNGLGNAPIHSALEQNIDCLKILIEKGADVNIQNIVGNTPLQHSAINNKSDDLKILLGAKGIEIDKRDFQHKTALFYAVEKKNLDSIKLLLEKRANPECEIRDGVSIAYTAMSCKDIDFVNNFLEMKPFAKDYTDSKGNNLIYLAMASGDCEILQLVYNKTKCDINHQNIFGSTALHGAVFHSSKIIEFLLSKGADITITNKDRKTPLDKAIEANVSEEIIELLSPKHQEVSQKTEFDEMEIFTPKEAEIEKDQKSLLGDTSDIESE